MHWGVDSGFPRQRPNFRRPFNGTVKTVFEIVEELSGMTPKFWGRYILGGPCAFQQAEKTYLEARQCRVLPIVSGLRNSLLRGGFRNGHRAAQRAVLRARQLGIPESVRIFADLEQWSFIRPEWIQGWWAGMAQSDYRGAGGLYGRPNVTMYEDDLSSVEETGIAFPRPVAPFARNQYDENFPGRQVVASRWGQAASSAARMPGPQGSDSFQDRELDNLMIDDRQANISISRTHWSNEPRVMGQDPVGQGPDNVMPRRFVPSRIDVGGITTTMWQYRFGCYALGGRVGLVDLNVALDEAYEEMW